MFAKDKFYVKKMIRDDGEQFVFDGKEILLSTDNTLLVRADLESSETEYTDIDGGEMLYQREQIVSQPFSGLMCSVDTSYWDLYFKITSFFQKNHYYKIVYTRRDGSLFAQRDAWLSPNIQISPMAKEDYSIFTLGFKLKKSSLYEYTEDSEGNETYANTVVLPLLTAASGGEEWNSIGQLYNSIGEVWKAGSGGTQNINIDSVEPIYPLWTVPGSCVNPVLQDNTTDTVAVYNGTVAAGQTLVVDFITGKALLGSATVTRNVSGQVWFKPGMNVAGFNSDGGTATTSKIQWNNVLG